MENKNDTLVLYVIRNQKGEYFRAKGYNGNGSTWVTDINKAKIYGKIGGARGVITWFANNYPKYPTPELLKMTVGAIEVLDETKRIEKAKENKIRKEIKKAEAAHRYSIKDAERKLEEAKNKLNKLLNKNA